MTPRLPAPAARIKGLDELRGVAAMIVMIYHVTGTSMLHASHSSVARLCSYVCAPHSAVLLFFALSGFIIGANYRSTLDRRSRWKFVVRRLARLGPIYWVVMAATGFAALRWSNLSSPALWISNLTFAGNVEGYRGIAAPLWPMNQVSWSLNYEWCFYLLFAVGCCQASLLGFAFAGCLALSVFGAASSLVPAVIAGYATGFLFWLVGLLLSRQREEAPEINWSLVARCLLLAAATERVAPLLLGMHFLGGQTWRHLAICNAADLAMLPAIYSSVAAATRRSPMGRKAPFVAAWVIPSVGLFAALATHHSLLQPRWAAAAAFLAAAGLAGPAISRPVLTWSVWRWLGERSYALYLVHCTVAYVLAALLPDRAGWSSFSLRFFLWLGCTLIVAHLLEGRFARVTRLFVSRLLGVQDSPAPVLPANPEVA